MSNLIMSYFEYEFMDSFKGNGMGVVDVGEIFKSTIGFPIDRRN